MNVQPNFVRKLMFIFLQFHWRDFVLFAIKPRNETSFNVSRNLCRKFLRFIQIYVYNASNGDFGVMLSHVDLYYYYIFIYEIE